MTEEVTFLSDSLSLSGILTTPQSSITGVVFLHGGGQSNKSRYAFLQSFFEKHGVSSFAFDFRGCGMSEGVFQDSSLTNRRRDATAALEFFKKQTSLQDHHIYLWGSSMGAHIACRAVDDVPNIRGLILQSPAAYGAGAESLELDKKFTTSIQREESWVDSPAFTSLETYNGKLLVVYGEQDDVVPVDVQNRYKQICREKGGTVYILRGGAHRLLSPQTALQEKARIELAKSAVSFMSS